MKIKFETDVDETNEKNEDDWFLMKTSFAKKASFVKKTLFAKRALSVKKASFAKKASSAKKALSVKRADDSKETALTLMMLIIFICLYLILYLSCLNDWSIHLSMIDLTQRLMIEVNEWERKHLTALFIDEERTHERTINFLSIDLNIKHQAKN